MSESPIKYSDNVRVKTGRDSNEFLAIVFRDHEQESPYCVCLYRYCVPGRCDTYHFDFSTRSGEAPRIRYFSDGWLPLAKALKMLETDLNQPQVVELLVKACSERRYRAYSRELIEDLLAVLAPKSKAYRACVKAHSSMMAKVRAEFEAVKVTPVSP